MAEPARHPPARHVLFVCVHNSGRSQMSHAFFESAAGPGLGSRSAGTEPATGVDATVIEAMAELGYDLGRRRPSQLTSELAAWADLVVTMGCGDACPYVPGTRYVDWDLRDPEGLPLEQVRLIRDEIRAKVGSLVDELTGRESRQSPDNR